MKYYITCHWIKRPTKRLRQRAFTLIEMIVAIAVFMLMVVILSQMFSVIQGTWLGGQARVESFSKARALLDILSDDLKNGIFRPDVASFPTGVEFYTRRSGVPTGGATVRDVSLVRYTLDDSNTTLQRGDLAIPWEDSGSLISFGETASLPNVGTVTERDMASGVLGFQLLFVQEDGTLSKVWDADKTRAFAVGLAVADKNTLNRMTSSQINALQSGLSSTVSGTGSIRNEWETYLNNVDWSSYPSQISGGGIRIFERYVPRL